MFKKKTTLPARPAILSKEEIMEDLSHAPSDDVVFESDAAEMKDSMEDSALSNDSKLNTPDKSYLMMSTFLKKIDHLENEVSKLQKKRESLRNLQENLINDMLKIEEELKKRSEIQ